MTAEMTAPITPGPWEATADEIDELLGQWTIRDSDGGYVADVRNPYTDYDMAVSYAESADCSMERHARLIAAAPDLLTALKTCRAYIAREDDADDMAECLEAAEDAIAKATTA
jgi:hypothetical protein